jgi:hypothetical protein
LGAATKNKLLKDAKEATNLSALLAPGPTWLKLKKKEAELLKSNFLKITDC